jgi:hypothetical protein
MECRVRNRKVDTLNESFTDRIYFKKCPNCGFKWESRENLLTDDKLFLIGYQANFKELATGLFYFNHSCEGTLAIPAYLFGDLYDGPIFSDRATDDEECPGYCLHREELRPCPAECECAYVREIVQIIKNWPKQ